MAVRHVNQKWDMNVLVLIVIYYVEMAKDYKKTVMMEI